MRALILSLALAATPALAETSDKDYLTSFLEDSLSDAGREVTVTGFAGALSSQATIETLTIADDQGIWLRLDGITLDWSRSALLSGELVVSELSARKLTLSRLPTSDPNALPSPEATSFSLPELPVSIDIGKLAIDQIVLAPEVLGQAVEGQLDAAMSLADGAGQASLLLNRTDDGPSGKISLSAGYDNASGKLDLDLSAIEAANGLIANALGLPGLPATDFTMTGSGPVSDFAADIGLVTDGVDRLTGRVTLAAKGDGFGLTADLSGNPAPLFLPDYADFLGTDLALTMSGERSNDGALRLDRFSLTARSLTVEGSGIITANGEPQDLSLTGTLASPEETPILLPLPGQETRIGRASFAVKAEGTAWTADTRIDGFDRPDFDAEALVLTGSGLVSDVTTGNLLDGSLQLSAKGLAMQDPGLAKAIGAELQGGFRFALKQDGGALDLSDIAVTGPGLAASGALQVAGLQAALATSGQLSLSVDDLGRFDVLSGLSLAGSGSLGLAGAYSPLSGAIDGKLTLAAQGLQLGIGPLDQLLSGASTASLSLLRDETGTRIRDLALQAGSVAVNLSGTLKSTGSDLAGTVAIDDLADLGPGYSGKASLDLSINGTPETAQLGVTGTADALKLGSETADKLLGGLTEFKTDLAYAEGTLSLQALDLANPQLELSAERTADIETSILSIKGKLADLGLLMAEMSGPMTVSGTIEPTVSGLVLDLAGRGPGRIDAKVKGAVASDLATADLQLTGTGQAALANLFIAPRVIEGPARFDLRLNGPLALSSLTGRITLSDGRLSDPDFGFSLGNIEAMADLKAGKAQVSATASVSTGGKLRIDGPVGLTAPFSSDLSVAVDRVRLVDPELYETTLAGRLGIKGALAGGAMISGSLALSETEIRVPESGIDAAGMLLEIDHRHEPAEVRATRRRAGLLDGSGSGNGGSSVVYRLDLDLSAPSRIFLRGRGIDAELGGELRLGGTTAAVVPSGEFALIRGRLDILGKRLVLDSANLVLAGSFVPEIEISASTESDGIQSVVSIAGAADDPEVTFSSVPDLPQEEVLARLLFGRGLDSISALQAARLAQAVAVLAGRGGEGMVARLRKGFGLDDLDVATAADGTTAVKAGKYLTDNLYTEVEVDQTGASKINLNLDLRPGVTAKGKLGADGETGIGIYIEKDY